MKAKSATADNEKYRTALRGLMEQLGEIKERNAGVAKEAAENRQAINTVWPHFINLMRQQCIVTAGWQTGLGEKAEKMKRRYAALASERKVLLDNIAKLKLLCVHMNKKE